MMARGSSWMVSALVVVVACGADDDAGDGADSAVDDSSMPSDESGESEGESGSASDDESESSGVDDGATTGEPLPPGYCDGGYHGPYRCECTAGASETCDGGGVRTCFAIDQEVITEEAWGPCGECTPGDQQACELDGGSGRQFCNVTDAEISFPDSPPTPMWGTCIAEDEIACQPGTDAACPDDGPGFCEVDAQGVPTVTGCA